MLSSPKALEPVGVMVISLFFISMVILASSRLKPIKETSMDLDLCGLCVTGTCSWLVSETTSGFAPLIVTGDDDLDECSPGLDPEFQWSFKK